MACSLWLAFVMVAAGVAAVASGAAPLPTAEEVREAVAAGAVAAREPRRLGAADAAAGPVGVHGAAAWTPEHHALLFAAAQEEAMSLLQVEMTASQVAFGRGRGAGRASAYVGPEEFDDSWWQPPPPVGPDSFLSGYVSRALPHHRFGYGGMPGGGFGNAYAWGAPAYHYPLKNMPWWRGRSFAPSAGAGYGGPGPYLPYLTPRDSYGMGGFGASPYHESSAYPLAQPYYYTPPPLSGDWNLPRNPPPPPGDGGLSPGGAAAMGGEAPAA